MVQFVHMVQRENVDELFSVVCFQHATVCTYKAKDNHSIKTFPTSIHVSKFAPCGEFCTILYHIRMYVCYVYILVFEFLFQTHYRHNDCYNGDKSCPSNNNCYCNSC